MVHHLPILILVSALGSLQELVNAAQPGDVVRVPPGVHAGPLSILKRLTLDGAGQAVIDGGGKGTVICVSAPGVTLRGLTIRASGDSLTMEDSGVKIENANDTVVEDCRIEDVLFGLYIATSSKCVFRRLWIGGKPLQMPRRGDGVRLWYSDDTLIERLEMVDSRDLVIWFAKRTVVRDCHVRGGRYGLHYMYCDDNDFVNNVFVENQVGGTIMYSRRIRMHGNRFERNRGPSAYGLLLKDADDIEAVGNEFVDNTWGVYFDNSPQAEDAVCTFRGNLFALNDAGVAILPDTRRARFEGNTFIDNLTAVEVLGHSDPKKNHWSGNYWSDHPGYDADGDGTGDVPYLPCSVYENLMGRFPELGLLRFSPSVGAIELAGRMFPITPSEPKLEDATPAMRPTVEVQPVGRRAGGAALPAAAALLALLPAAAWAWARSVLR